MLLLTCSVWCGAQPGQIASQVGSVRRVLFDLNYTVVEQLEALDDELFVLCAAPLPSQLVWSKVCTGWCRLHLVLCRFAYPLLWSSWWRWTLKSLSCAPPAFLTAAGCQAGTLPC